MTTLADLAPARRWTAWRNENRGGKLTKVPYCAAGRQAKSDNRDTWLTHDEAMPVADAVANGLGGGVGVMLGGFDAVWLGGIDLDTCRDPASGAIGPCAREVIDRIGSYAEVSPSGSGVKVYFAIEPTDVPDLRRAMGTDHGRQYKRRGDGADHPPAIELYISNRYFAVTWQMLDDALDLLRTVSVTELRWLVEEAGPRFAGTPGRGDDVHHDVSRSAKAFRLGAQLRRAGKSFEELCETIATHPDTAEWCRDKGDERQMRRIWERAAPNVAAIRVVGGNRHLAADAGLSAIADAPFYQRDRNLVRICRIKGKASDGSLVTSPAVTNVTAPMLGRALGQSTRWETLDRKGQAFAIDPPREVVEQIASMIDEWPFHPLYGVIGTPTMRPDGSLLVTQGYDPATGYVLFDPPPMPAIADAPTRQDALDALASLNTLLNEFPFANEPSRSVALSMLLTPVLRGALAPATPMHVITAPEPGTGKSYLQDIASTIAVGDRCAVLSVAKGDPPETEKRLVGAALAQSPIIALDNVSVGELLMGDFLCQVTERPLLLLRRLGGSDLVRVPNTFTIFANGNNLIVSADAVRRTIQCALDANVEVPGTREFKADPVATVLANRGRYIAACLTIARAYVAADRPNRLTPLPSYPGWSDTVRSALVWLDCPDPVETVDTIRVQDPIRQARSAVFVAWAKELQPDTCYQTGELIKAAEQYAGSERARPGLWDALYAIAAPRGGYQTIDANTLGRWLRDNQGTICVGYKLTAERSDAHRPRWRLETV